MSVATLSWSGLAEAGVCGELKESSHMINAASFKQRVELTAEQYVSATTLGNQAQAVWADEG